MTEQKHTPGPWIVIPGGDEWGRGRVGTIEPKPDTMVETNYWTVAECNNRRDECLSNAKLIATAPDLLADLIVAAGTLRHYEALHRAKGTAESLEKAEVNAGLASRFEQTIAKATQ
ncbi:hypothetical protein J3P89_18340 [Pseudomonas sp. Z1-14]|uniref:hypothetical protein n=1 Tax=Pseudomonas sp. Z1-14 TaxID=2817409 RepID=UPI003DA8A9C1